jgi:PAS domain-containing protein
LTKPQCRGAGGRLGMVNQRGSECVVTPSSELLEALPVAIYTTDAEGRITFYNEAAAVLWGADVVELRQKKL